MATPRSAHLPPGAMTAAAAEHAVVLRRQLVASRGASYVDAQLAARRWQSPTSAVIVLHNGPLTDAQRLWVALSSAPPGSVLHGLSAAQYDGFRGFAPDGLQIVVPGSARSQRAARVQLPPEWGVHIRWSTMLGDEDVNRRSMPPRTRMARSIIDASSERITERRARVLVLAATQQGLVTVPGLWDALSRRGRCRNRAIIAESILDAGGGVQSLPEHEFGVICRQLGLPQPARRAVLNTPGGRYFLDTEWRPWGIRVEIHGLPHLTVQRWDEDILRQNEINIGGSGLLVFSSYAVRHLKDRVAQQLLRMFDQRGWRGSRAA